MESIKVKSNARKSTYSGKPSITNQEQMRMRQALKPESNANHVPVKASPTTWKRSGWSLSARVHHGSREGLLTPMVIAKDKESTPDIASSNGDIQVSSRSVDTENVARSEKKSPDQRSLWSLFSAPKVQENVAENTSQVDPISNGISRSSDEMLTPHHVQKLPSRDPRIRKREESKKELKTSPPSFNLLSKMKPLKNASRNFFAHLGKKPDVSVSQDVSTTSEAERVTLNTKKETENAATEPLDSRLGNRTSDESSKKHLGDNRTDGAKKVDNHEQNCKTPTLREEVTTLSNKARTDPGTGDKEETSVMEEYSKMVESDTLKTNYKGESAPSDIAESVPVKQKQTRDSPVGEDMKSQTSSLAKQEEGPSKDLTMPTLTLPPDIEHGCYASDVSSELDESDILFIDEQAHADHSPDSDEDSNKVQEESHVLRVWSLQSAGETSSDFQNVDQSSSFSGDASSSLGLDDSLPLAGNESLNSLDVSKTENDVRLVERLHEDENSDDLSKSNSEKIIQTDDAESTESSMLINRNSEEGPPKLQAQPNTHHLLQELDSLLECSTLQSDTHSNMQLESSENLNVLLEANGDISMLPKESKDSNMPLEANEEMSETDSLNHSKESESSNDTEPARNIFSLFSSGKRPLSPKNIVQLDEGKPREQSNSSSYCSAFSKDSIVLSGSCSGERNRSIATEDPEDANAVIALSSKESPDTRLSTLSSNESSDTGLPTFSGIKSPDTRIPSLTLETCTGDGLGSEQNDICLRSSQPPELCLEVNPSSLGEKEVSHTFTIPPEPEEYNVEDISFLAFESRDDLFAYSKAMKLKMQRKSTQTNKVPAKKFVYPAVKNVKMKKKKKNPIEAKIKAFEQDLLWSMESRGLTEIVHPVLSRKGVALDTVKKNDLVVNVRNEELERISHKKWRHKTKHKSETEVSPMLGVRWQGKRSNSVEISRSKHGPYSSLHVRKNIVDKDHETEHVGEPSDTGKVVGLKHGHYHGLEKNFSKIQSSGRSDKKTEIKKSKPKHSSNRQEWEICPEELHATSERPSLKLKFISKAKANSTSPTKVEQSPLALSTKPRESTVPLKSPTSHIPVNVQQLHVPSSSATPKNVVHVAPKPVEEKLQPAGDKPQPVEDKPQPSTRLPEEESLPFKPYEKPVASKKSAFVSDALEDLLQGVDINNKLKPLISPSTISVSNAKVVFKVPSRQSHSVKTLDMALKRQKPLNVSSPNYRHDKIGLGFKNSYDEQRDEKKKKKKKKKDKHKDRVKEKIKKGYVFGTGPDDLVRKLPKLPFACYGKTYARPLFAREQQVSNTVGKKSKGFLEVRNVLSLSGKATVKRHSDEVEVHSAKKIKQEPKESDENLPPTDENLPPILNINLPSRVKGGDALNERSQVECTESKSEEAPSEARVVKKCAEYCRLGCICSSLNDLRTVQEMSTHCRKVDCMFDCLCKKNSSQAITGTRIRRPPTYSHDMLFYDDSYKFWKGGDNEGTSIEVKKLQLLDHLPECEKRNLVSTCARTRTFVPDKPEKWIKWKRKQLGDKANQHLERKRASESQVTPEGSNAHNQGPGNESNVVQHLASEDSHAHSTNNNQNMQNETQVSVKQQKLSRKHQFIPLAVPSKIGQENQLSNQASKADDFKSKVKNIPAQTTVPLSCAMKSAQENASTSQVLSTFIPVAKQYLLNGTLMNMVVLPNGNRVLLPANTCPPFTIKTAVEQKKTFLDPEVSGLAPKVECAQNQSSTIALQSAKPNLDTSVQSTPHHEKGLKLPIQKSGSSVSCVASGLQRPVLPLRYQITSSGIIVAPGVVVATSSPVTRERSPNVSQGKLSQRNQRNCQTSSPSENCGLRATVTSQVLKAPVSSTRTESGIPISQAQQTELPQLNSNINKISLPSQTYVVVNPPVKAKTCAQLMTTSSKQNAADSKPSPQGCISIIPVSTESVVRSAINVPKQEHSVSKPVNQDCSPSESESHEDMEETHSTTSRKFSGDSDMNDMRITKTFFMDIEGKSMYIMISTDAKCEWTDAMESEVKQAITKFLDPSKSKQIIHLLKDMELNLWDKGDRWIRLCLTKYKPSERSEDVMADKSKTPTGNNTEAPNASEEGNLKTIASSVTQTSSAVKPFTPEDKIQLNDGSSNIGHDAVASRASNDVLHVKQHDSQHPLGTVPIRMGKDAEEATSNAVQRSMPITSLASESSQSVTKKLEINSKDATSNVIERTPSKTCITVGASRSSSERTKATSKSHDKSASMSDNGKETSKKLSSSLPEFDKLSEIVKRTSVDDDDGLSPIKKTTRNVAEWLHNPKMQKPCERQNYSGVKGPWFTTEKEGVKVVLQRNKSKRSPFGKGGKSPSKPMPQRIMKRSLSSSVLVTSPKKSPKHEEMAKQSTKDNDSNSCIEKSSTKDEAQDQTGVPSGNPETSVWEVLQTSEESVQKSKYELFKGSTEFIPKSETTSVDRDKSSDSESLCYISKSSGLFVDNNANDSESTSTSQIEGRSEEEASEPLVNRSKKFAVNEETVICTQSEQQNKGKASVGSFSPEAISPSPDAKIDDGLEAEKEIVIDDTAGTLGIEHFARFSEEDAYGPLDFDEEVSASFDLPADCNDDDNSIASLRIDDGTTEDIPNADLGKNILSLPKDHSRESTEESSEVKDDTPQNLQLPANSKVNASTDHSAGSRASSLSHMKDEVCTDSPHNDSQSLKAESNFNVGIPPSSKNAPEVPVVEESLDTPSAPPEHTSENQPSIPGESIQTETAPVKKSDIYPKKSPMLNIKFVATSNENCTSPICTSPVCPSPVCQSPLSEDLTENTQDRLPIPIKSSDPSDASLSDTEIDVVNTDRDDDDEIDVETVGGVTPVVPNLNPYSSLRDITSRLSSALQKEQRVNMPKRSRPKSSSTSSLKLSVGKSSGTLSFKLSIGHNMGSPRKIKTKSFRPAPSKMNQQSSLTTHVKSKKKKSKRKSPVCPAKQWDSPQFQEVYKDNPAREEVDKSDGPQRNSRTHNILERRRREEMRKAFTELSTIIHGSAQHTVPPKIQILNKAILEVRELNMKEKELQKEKEQFKKQQRRLVYVHSNLLHHARCSGQIVFPEGSRLAESMERIRSGFSKHISTSPGDEGVQDSSPDLQGKKRKTPDMEPTLDSHLTKKEPRTATSGSSCLVIVKKKNEEKNASSHSEKKRSDSTKSAAFNPFPKLKDTPRVIKGERYLPVTKKDLKTQLKYSNSAEVKTSHDTLLKGNRKSALDLSMPSGSREFSVNSYGVYGMRDHDSSSDNEEALPIDCYVSSSDEPEEYDEADFRMDDDEEQYSDDGFIPESEDEITADVNDKKFEKRGDDGDESEGEDSDQEVVTINIDLDDFEQDNVGSRSDMESNAEVDRRKRTKPKIKEGFQRKEESSLENEDSDDVLVLTKETSSFDDKLKKKEKERRTLRSKDDSTVFERNECKSQSKSMNLSRLDQVTKQVSFIPSGSMSTTNSNASQDSLHSTKPINPTENTSQDSLLSTKPINPTGKVLHIKKDRAPLVNVIDEIMNRLKGDAQPSARSSAGEERTDEALGSANIGPDILDSSSDDEEEGQEKLLSASPTSPTSAVKATDSLPSEDGQGSAILKHKGDVLPSKELRTTSGGVQPPVIMLDDSDSSSEEEMDRQERTLVAAAVSIASSSVQHKVRNDLAVSLKHKKDARQSCAILNDSDSSSDDEVDGQKSTTAPSAATLNNIRHKEAISLKTKEVAQPCGAMSDYSNSSSHDEVDDQESTKTSKAVSLNSIDHEKENSSHVGEQESLPSTSHTKNSGSVPSDMQHAAEKNSVESLQKKSTVLPMKGALADLISSVKTRVTNDDASDDSDDSESEDDEVSEDKDSEDDSDDEESNDDERMEVGEGKEDIDAEDDSSSNIAGSEKQDITDIEKDVAGPSYVLEEKGQRSQTPEGSSGNTNMAGTSNSALRTEEEGDNQDSSSVDQTLTDPSSTPEEKGQERGKSSIGDDFSGLSFPNMIRDSFSVDGDVNDDDVACLSYAAMGNDEDNEALFDAENPSSPFSPISLDMDIASDDDILDTMDDLDEDPQSSCLKLPKSSTSNAGISTDEPKSRPQEISLQAKQSSGGHHKPSTSSKQDLTLDEAISFLNVEKNSDGTLNVFLKGDYNDEKLDELFEKPEVMDYIMSAAAKKS